MILRKEVMARPAAERLDHALYLLDLLAGMPHRHEGWLRQTYGLSPCEARLFCALNAASPRIVTREAAMTAVYGGFEPECGPSIINVWVSRLRAKVGRDVVLTHRSAGFSVPRRIAMPYGPAPLPARSAMSRWTEEEDVEALRMLRNGSSFEAIADELDRTPGAVRYRLRLLQHCERRAV